MSSHVWLPASVSVPGRSPPSARPSRSALVLLPRDRAGSRQSAQSNRTAQPARKRAEVRESDGDESKGACVGASTFANALSVRLNKIVCEYLCAALDQISPVSAGNTGSGKTDLHVSLRYDSFHIRLGWRTLTRLRCAAQP